MRAVSTIAGMSLALLVGCGPADGVPGYCQGENCDDGQECTADLCVAATSQCSNAPVADGTSCNGGEGMCQDGMCEPTTSNLCRDVNCDDAKECTADLCVAATGQCSNTPVANGTSCDGANGTCQGGSCETSGDACAGIDCNDDLECTEDLCANGNCSNLGYRQGQSCAGGTGICQAGVCRPHEDRCAGVNCSDGRECTHDGVCNTNNGQCEGRGFEAVDTPCNEDGGSLCNGIGACVVCNRSAQCADDGNVCTVATCNGGTCETMNIGGSCDFMGQAGTCNSGICIKVDHCDPYICQDRGPCIADQCNPLNGQCSYPNAPNGTQCSANGYDGECRSGVCDLCAPVNCNDNNPCTIDGHCNPSNGQCQGAQNVADGTSCGGAATACLQGVCGSDILNRIAYNGTRADLEFGQYAKLFPADYLWGHAGFYFNFLGSGVDHQIERIASGFFLAKPALYVVTAGHAVYRDQSGGDDYSWQFNTQELPIGSIRRLTSGTSAGGAIDVDLGPLSPGLVPVLLGFSLSRATDNNLERIAVQLYGGRSLRLVVEYREESPTEDYSYSIYYALVPSHRVRATGVSGSSSVKREDTRAINAQRPILQGFYFSFLNGDHHIDQLGARLNPGVVKVWFNDQNNDDSFFWQVRWADLE